MKRANSLILILRIVKDTKGQDLFEYALMLGFLAVASGAALPNLVPGISAMFSKVADTLSKAVAS